MKYQDCIELAQAPDEMPDGTRQSGVNTNPRTGLATDYLNHFNEAIMLLEMLPACPECLEDFLAWRPMSYREHFAAAHFKGRDLAIAAYDEAEPNSRARLMSLASTMTAVLLATRDALRSDMPADAAGMLALSAAAGLKPLIARAGAVINGEADAEAPAPPQAVVDGLMKRFAR